VPEGKSEVRGKAGAGEGEGQSESARSVVTGQRSQGLNYLKHVRKKPAPSAQEPSEIRVKKAREGKVPVCGSPEGVS